MLAVLGRFRNGHTGPPTRTTDEDGSSRFVCEDAPRFESVARSRTQAILRRRRECRWCGVGAQLIHGKGPGPDGPKTLCSACSSRYRAGHTAAPLRDADGNFVCDSCSRKFSSLGALGGHRRFCGQLSADFDRDHLALVDDSKLTDADGGAAEVALPQRRASGLPTECEAAALAAYDFTRYFFRSILPAATLTLVTPELLDGPRGEDERLAPPPPPPAQSAAAESDEGCRWGCSKAAAAAQGDGEGGVGAEGEAPKKKEKKRKRKPRMVVIEEVARDPSEPIREMVGEVQAAGWAEWEEMLAAPPATPPSQLSTALHVFATTLAVVDLLEPNKLKAGVTLARDAATAAERLLPGIPINAFTWPEVLRMVIAAKNAGRAPKQREVAMRALLDAGIASAAIAHNATRQLGGSHTGDRPWSAAATAGASGGGEKEKEGEEDEGEEERVVGGRLGRGERRSERRGRV